MKTKAISVFILFLLILGFQNCGTYQSADFDSSLLQSQNCEEQFFNYFESSFYKTFREIGCNNCHSQSNLLSFADDDVRVAFSNFSKRVPNDFVNRIALDNHQQSLLNYNKSNLVSSFTSYASEFEAIELSCQPLTDLAHVTGLREMNFFESPGGQQDTRCGFNDPVKLEVISSPYSTAQPKTETLEWDLGAEDSRLDGVIARLEVSTENPQGFPLGAPTYACPNQDGYQVGNLRFVSTVNNVSLKNVSILLNGDDQNNLHYFGVNLTLGPSDGEVYLLGQNGGFTIYTMVGSPILKTDSWKLQIETIQVNN